MFEGTTGAGIVGFANTQGRIKDQMEVLQKKVWAVFESGQSTSQCRDTGEGKYHSGIYKQECIVARYMN